MIYEDHLKEALKLPQTVGIIGGSPRHAVYIVGFQDESFIALDPHFIQTTVNTFEQTFDTSVSEHKFAKFSIFDSLFCLLRVTRVHRRRNCQREKWTRLVHWAFSVVIRPNSKSSVHK